MRSVLYAVLIALCLAVPAQVVFWAARHEYTKETIYEKTVKSTVQVRSENGGFGQGVAVMCKGRVMILTAGHVVKACDGRPIVTKYNDFGVRTWKFSSCYTQENVDLGLIDGTFDIPPVKIRSSLPRIGDNVYSHMNGFNVTDTMFPFVVSKMSSLYLVANGDSVPGFSGSGIFMDDQLVGILTHGNNSLNLSRCYNADAIRRFITDAERD